MSTIKNKDGGAPAGSTDKKKKGLIRNGTTGSRSSSRNQSPLVTPNSTPVVSDSEEDV
jgi:hypothetical protein